MVKLLSKERNFYGISLPKSFIHQCHCVSMFYVATKPLNMRKFSNSNFWPLVQDNFLEPTSDFGILRQQSHYNCLKSCGKLSTGIGEKKSSSNEDIHVLCHFAKTTLSSAPSIFDLFSFMQSQNKVDSLLLSIFLPQQLLQPQLLDLSPPSSLTVPSWMVPPDPSGGWLKTRGF